MVVSARYSSDIRYKAAVSIAFFASSLAAAVAVSNPATSYELSVFSSTPVIFWILISLSLVMALTVAVTRHHQQSSNYFALAASVYSIVLITILPTLRGYYFLGEGDMLTHLGYTEELLAGIITPSDLFYPAAHISTGLISLVTGLTVQKSFMLLPLIFVSLFVCFIPLCTRQLMPSTQTVTYGTILALLLLPINHVTIHLEGSPRNFSLFLIPLALFTIYLAVISPSLRKRIVAFLNCLAILFFHPMYAISLAVFLTATGIGLWILNWLTNDDVIPPSRFLYPSLSLGVVTWFWIQQREVFTSALGRVIYYAIQGVETGGEASQRGASLSEIGGSLIELFMKIFIVQVIFSALVIIYLLIVIIKVKNREFGITDSQEQRYFLLASAFGLFPIATLLPILLMADRLTLLFRYAAFIMVFVTIFSALAMSQFTFDDLPLSGTATVSATLLVLLVLSILIMHPSPYVYQETEHVTKEDVTGYKTLFEYEHENYSFDHVRSDASRYGNAINGPSARERSDYYHEDRWHGGAPDHFADQNLSGFYPSPTYLVTTSADHPREIELYNEFRFDEADYKYLERDSEIQKVYSSGGFNAYTVKSE